MNKFIHIYIYNYNYIINLDIIIHKIDYVYEKKILRFYIQKQNKYINYYYYHYQFDQYEDFSSEFFTEEFLYCFFRMEWEIKKLETKYRTISIEQQNHIKLVKSILLQSLSQQTKEISSALV